MRYVNPYVGKDRQEFISFIYENVGKYLKSETVEMRAWIVTLTIQKSNLSLFKQLMDKYDIHSYKVLGDDNDDINSDTISIKYLEQYPRNDKKEERRFNQLSNELYEIREGYTSTSITYQNMDEFEEIDKVEGFAYFILDKEYEEDAKNIVNHILGLDIDINHADVISEKYDINGLVWFKIPNYRVNNNYASYHVLCVFMDSEINHCIYYDRDGKFTLDIRMQEKDSRHSQVRFRNDLKMVFKSSWEANIARVFNYLGIKFEYEKDSFPVKSESFSQYYFPDFFLENNTIIEVKGFWDFYSLKKVSLFKEQHKGYTLLTLDSDMYYTLDKLYRDVIPEWEHGSVVTKKEILPVVGITRSERKKFVSKIKTGDELLLKRDSENPYDKNAILVTNQNGDSIGFIAKDWASVYSDKLDVGMRYRAIVKSKEAKVIKLELERTNFDEDVLYDFLKVVESKK